MVDLGDHLIHGSLPPQVNTPNDISIGSVIFAELTHMTNRHTETQIDHAK